MSSSSPSSTEYQFRTYTVKPEGHHRYLHPVVLDLISKHIPTGNAIVDVGCGNGGLATHLTESYDVCGIDLSESGIAAARQQCPDGRFEVASVYDDLTKVFHRTFNAAVSLEVIEHIYDPHAYLRQIHAAVEPNGVVVISTPYHGYLKNLVMAVGNRMDDHLMPLKEGGHIKFWS